MACPERRARPVLEEGGLGARHEHARVVVALEGRRWLVDVGSGASPLAPVPIDDPHPVDDGPSVRRVVRHAPALRSEVRGDDGTWEPEWWFDQRPAALSDFVDRCRHQEHAPDSHFRKGPVCTLPTPTGKVTLTAHRLIRSVDGQRTETPVSDPVAVLAEVFGVHLPPGALSAG